VKLGRSLRVLLALALLAAWTNALVHPIAHVDEAGEFIHLAGGHEGDSRNGSSADPVCDAVTAVTACVAGSSALAVAGPQAFQAISGQAAEVRHAPRLAYRSQAPPQFS